MERSSGAAPSLGIAFRPAENGASVIELVGELDLSTIPKIEARLLKSAASHERLVLDLSRVCFIDSSGIALLITAHQSTAEGGKMHTVVSRSSQVERVLALAGIDRALPIFLDRNEAIAALTTPPVAQGRGARAA